MREFWLFVWCKYFSILVVEETTGGAEEEEEEEEESVVAGTGTTKRDVWVESLLASCRELEGSEE